MKTIMKTKNKTLAWLAAFVVASFTACGGGGNSVAIPSITAFGASNNSVATSQNNFIPETFVNAGSPVYLRSTFSNGSGVITPGNISITSGAVATATPAATTTYTLTVTNSAGATTTKTCLVTVVPLPVITSLTATPTSLSPGGIATISWTVSDQSASCFLDLGQRQIGGGANGDSHYPVSPTVTTTYTLLVENAGMTPVSKNITITVIPNTAPTITQFTATPAIVAPGGSSSLTATFTNGTGIITPGNLTVTSGLPVVVTPSITTTYTLTVSSPGNPSATSQTAAVNIGPGTIAIIAGQPGNPGTTNGHGTSALFNYPTSVAVDGSDNVYIADTSNNLIRMILPSGVVTTIAGIPGVSGSADSTINSSGTFNGPLGVASDTMGNVYVADTNNNTIRKITPNGTLTTLAGKAGLYGSSDGTGAAATFWSPSGIAVDRSGNVYVADTKNNTIRKITPAAVVTTLAGIPNSSGMTNGNGTLATFSGPTGVACDTSGNVYVADYWNNAVRKITPNGTVSTLAILNYMVTGVSVTPSGDIVAVTGNGYFYRISSANGSILGTLPSSTGTGYCVAVDLASGYIYTTGFDDIIVIPGAAF